MADNKALTEKLREWPVSVKNYVKELQTEMRTVTWPSKDQVRGTTVVVIVTVFAFAAYFAVIDGIFTRLIGKLFQALARQS